MRISHALVALSTLFTKTCTNVRKPTTNAQDKHISTGESLRKISQKTLVSTLVHISGFIFSYQRNSIAGTGEHSLMRTLVTNVSISERNEDTIHRSYLMVALVRLMFTLEDQPRRPTSHGGFAQISVTNVNISDADVHISVPAT